MPSPFPGMDPYLEPRWGNVHLFMMTVIATVLKRVLPAGLEARPDERVQIETMEGDPIRTIRSDSVVIESGRRALTSNAGTSVAELPTPAALIYHREPVTYRNIQIVDALNGDKVITVIQVLSPGNKDAGRLNQEYRQKLEELEDAGVNWVEIDLLRSDRSRMTLTWDQVPPNRRELYLATAYRARTGAIAAYPISLRQRLPRIPIPLRDTDADIPLDLQTVIDRVYDDGPFDSIDYTQAAKPPLSPPDAEWALGLISARSTVQ